MKQVCGSFIDLTLVTRREMTHYNHVQVVARSHTPLDELVQNVMYRAHVVHLP